MSAYVSSFVFCESIQTQFTPAGPRYQIVGPLQVLNPVAIPSNYSFSVSCTISGFEIENTHKVALLLLNPDGTECARPIDNIEFTIHKEDNNADKPTVPSVSLNVDLRNIILRMEGLYSVRVILDDISIGEYKIQAVVR